MRKTTTVSPPAEWAGRDIGKVFKITEMSAARAEKWAMRAALTIKGTQARIPEAISQFGMAGIIVSGANSILGADIPFGVLEPLLDEMFGCVQIVRDPGAPDRATGQPLAFDIISDDDIEEPRTRFWLRAEVLSLHLGFSVADAFSKWISVVTMLQPNLESIPTSPP